MMDIRNITLFPSSLTGVILLWAIPALTSAGSGTAEFKVSRVGSRMPSAHETLVLEHTT